MIKRISAAAFALIILLSLFACRSAETGETRPDSPKRVVALSSSLAEVWLLAGGGLVGTTSDTLERGFETLPEDITVVGTVKEPNIEAILELKPDLVILSADIASHVALRQTLMDALIDHHYAHIETFGDYFSTLEEFCGLTGDADALERNGVAVNNRIHQLLESYAKPVPPPTYLLIRVHSSGGKVIADDHVACDILGDLGAVNIAAQNESLLSDLSLEAILESDPDYIFVVTMGDEAAALQTLEQMFVMQPAWQTLTAVQGDRVTVLSKELFHYKPCVKCGEAYETLIGLLNE